MTQETLNNNIINLKCKAGNLAASWSDKVRLGKWCDEQECALMLVDWGIDILCDYDPNSEHNCFTEDQMCELITKLNKTITFKCNCC